MRSVDDEHYPITGVGDVVCIHDLEGSNSTRTGRARHLPERRIGRRLPAQWDAYDEPRVQGSFVLSLRGTSI